MIAARGVAAVRDAWCTLAHAKTAFEVRPHGRWPQRRPSARCGTASRCGSGRCEAPSGGARLCTATSPSGPSAALACACMRSAAHRSPVRLHRASRLLARAAQGREREQGRNGVNVTTLALFAATNAECPTMHHKSAHAKHVEESAASPQLQLGESSDAAAAAVPTAAAAAAEGGTAAGGLAGDGGSSGIQAGEGAGVAAGRAGSAAAAAVAEREAELAAVGFGLGSDEARLGPVLRPHCRRCTRMRTALPGSAPGDRIAPALRSPGPGRARRCLASLRHSNDSHPKLSGARRSAAQRSAA